MGFESSRMARRRLAALAGTNPLVAEALSAGAYPGLFDNEGERPSLVATGDPVDLEDAADARSADASHREGSPVAGEFHVGGSEVGLHVELDRLAIEIMSTPGAGSALIAAYAAQARALSLVVESARLAAGAPLPVAVLRAAESALVPPPVLAHLNVA